MAFPTVGSSVSGNTGVSTTTHSFTLPAGIAAGDLLLAGLSFDGVPVVTWPAGWTELFATDAAGNAARVECRYRVADGLESTLIITTDVPEASARWAYRIPAASWHGTTPPEVGTPATGTTEFPNPPSLAPSWGSADTLWVATYGWDNGNAGHDAFPANYGSNQLTSAWANNAGCGIAVATREAAAASENPGTGDLGLATEQWVAATIAVRPVTATGRRFVLH